MASDKTIGSKSPVERFWGKILVTTDLSDLSFAAFSYGQDLIPYCDELEVMSVASRPPIQFTLFGQIPNESEWTRLCKLSAEKTQAFLQDIVSKHFSGQSPRVYVTEHLGKAADAIVERATQEKFDLIVIASHGHGFFERVTLGSTAEQVMRGASCPVLLVHPTKNGDKQNIRPRKILVSTDFSLAAEAAYKFAEREARRTDAELVVANVLEDPLPGERMEVRDEKSVREVEVLMKSYRASAQARVEEIAREFWGGKARGVVLDLDRSVAQTLNGFAKKETCDLIVIAGRGTGKSLFSLGGVTERLIRIAECPILMVPVRWQE